MSALVLGLILTLKIFSATTKSVDSIDEQVTSQINDLFQKDETREIIVGLGGENTAKVKQGTDAFGIPFAFSPADPRVWGTGNSGCSYSIEIRSSNSEDACSRKGWEEPLKNIFPGTEDMKFERVTSNNGFALLKISVPESVPPCTQRFYITVECRGEQPASDYFDIEVKKRGL